MYTQNTMYEDIFDDEPEIGLKRTYGKSGQNENQESIEGKELNSDCVMKDETRSTMTSDAVKGGKTINIDMKETSELPQKKQKTSRLINQEERERVRAGMKELALSESFQVSRGTADHFYSFEAQELLRKHVMSATSSDFYEQLFNPMNAEFEESTLKWSMQGNILTIKCKYKDCTHRLSFQFELNESSEMIQIKIKRASRLSHSVSAHLKKELRAEESHQKGERTPMITPQRVAVGKMASSDESQETKQIIKDIGLDETMFKMMTSVSGDKCFYSVEMAKIISEKGTFASRQDLQEKFIDKLNLELGSEALKLAFGNKLINVCCMFKNCPLKLAYSFEKNQEGQATSIQPAKIQTKYHSCTAHQRKTQDTSGLE